MDFLYYILWKGIGGVEDRDGDKPLWGLRVLKFDGAIAPRVLKFDSGSAAEGCGGRLTFIDGALL